MINYAIQKIGDKNDQGNRKISIYKIADRLNLNPSYHLGKSKFFYQNRRKLSFFVL